MFEEIFFPRTAEIYRAAPLAEQRERHLRHLKDAGYGRYILRKYANNNLNLALLMDLKEGEQVDIPRIEAAAAIWARPNGRRCVRAAASKAHKHFISTGIQWMRFLGWLNEPERERHPHHAEVTVFEEWQRQERGLAEETIQCYCQAANHFFFWLAGKGTPLDAVQITDIDDSVTAEHERGIWKRRTTHGYVQRLRAFFLFAESQGWCRAGLAAGIVAPGFMVDETVPRGIRREDVLRLMNSIQGERSIDKRDQAILILFVAFGLRAGEVSGLRLDDLDWENEIIRVRCPKTRRTHIWPLTLDVGNAILRYIREARPVDLGRSLFYTTQAPIQPIGRKSFGKIVSDRLAGIGIVTGPRGTHALRHAAAQHLLDQGMSMKVIGDFLGHRDPSSTTIYAKVNLTALREVAALDLEDLV